MIKKATIEAIESKLLKEYWSRDDLIKAINIRMNNHFKLYNAHQLNHALRFVQNKFWTFKRQQLRGGFLYLFIRIPYKDLRKEAYEKSQEEAIA